MLGSGNPTPYDIPLIVFLAAIAVILFIGAFAGSAWPPTTALLVRRGAFAIGVMATVLVHIVTPTRNGIVGAGRVLFMWPAIGLMVVAFAVWSWRAGRL